MTSKHKITYICKYAPVELFQAFGADYGHLTTMPETFGPSVALLGSNTCGFGKNLIDRVADQEIEELVLTNCCDTIRTVYDVLEQEKEAGRLPALKFLYFMDLPRDGAECSIDAYAFQIRRFIKAYEKYSGIPFDRKKFEAALHEAHENLKQEGEAYSRTPYIALLGGKAGNDLQEMAEERMPLPVRNETCVEGRRFGEMLPEENLSDEDLIRWYAAELLRQIPCMRMQDATGRRRLLNDPNLKGIIYHTIRFCDFYSFEYGHLRTEAPVPVLKIETDYTKSASGQMATRLDAFAEELRMKYAGEDWLPGKENNVEGQESLNGASTAKTKDGNYFAGIDSGSTSTDAVILDREGQIVSSVILPTGRGAGASAEKALDAALEKAGISSDDLAATVATGYGRAVIGGSGQQVTEISCHARGAHYLNPEVRCVVDIGGQDCKAIQMDADGRVENFAMNDKCAAGTGRFLDMMARTLEMSLDEMSKLGLTYKEDITISSTCTVFAESEIVSLIAQNKDPNDIVHGINKSVANRTASLVARVRGKGPYMMTGGVAQNAGLVKALETRLGDKLIISDKAQLCGAIGAALYARDGAGVR